MTVAYAAGTRAEMRDDSANLLVTLLLVGASLNGLAVRMAESWQLHGLDAPLMGISPFEILAMVIGAKAILSSGRPRTSFYPWLELILGAAMLFPSSALAWFAIAFYGLFAARETDGERRAGFLLFVALAGCSIWSSVLLKWWAGPASALDAHTVWRILSWLRNDLAVSGNVVGVPTGHNLIIMTACTSASLLPKALLGLAALNHLAGARFGRRFALAAALAAMLSVAINILRLSLMASSGDFYLFVHGPVGANIFDMGQTLAVVGLSLWAARR